LLSLLQKLETSILKVRGARHLGHCGVRLNLPRRLSYKKTKIAGLCSAQVRRWGIAQLVDHLDKTSQDAMKRLAHTPRLLPRRRTHGKHGNPAEVLPIDQHLNHLMSLPRDASTISPAPISIHEGSHDSLHRTCVALSMSTPETTFLPLDISFTTTSIMHLE
jgi:hypothetical protein